MKQQFDTVTASLPELLLKHRVEHVVMSPGSRNAAIMQTIEQCEQLTTHVEVDERSAAFQALGICMITNSPVAVVCTSGTAVLNLGPALCEAYYRQLPLIAITADRPPEWIDRADSQTMRQPHVFDNYVLASASVDDTLDSEDKRWYNNCLVNYVLNKATGHHRGPVHLNIHTNGIYSKPQADILPRHIERIQPTSKIDDWVASELIEKIMAAKSVLIVAGQMQPDSRLNKALTKFSKNDNIAIFAEPISNLHLPENCPVDMLMSRRDLSHIDILITIGGSIVSKNLKRVLRKADIIEHWHVGTEPYPVDTFKSLNTIIETTPVAFFESLNSKLRKSMKATPSAFKQETNEAEIASNLTLRKIIDTLEWCELKAVYAVCNELIPKSWNVQLSNGTTVRYAMLGLKSTQHRCDCNRGVSGIDGSTSTAIGASLVYDDITLLITGDTSAMYDVGALLSPNIPPRFKMVVIDNKGGAIFDNVASTRELPSHNKFFDLPVNLPVKDIAAAASFNYFEASSLDRLQKAWKEFAKQSDRPSILHLHGFNKEHSLKAVKCLLTNN